MSLLSNFEACNVANAFLFTLYGDKTFYRWKEVKDKMKFETERDYANWLLDIVKHYDLDSINNSEQNSSAGGGRKSSRRQKYIKKSQRNESSACVDGEGEGDVPPGSGEVTGGAEDGGKGDESGDDNWDDNNDGIDDDYEEIPPQPYMPKDIKAPDGIKYEVSDTVTGQNSTPSALSAQQILGMTLKSDGQSHFQRKFPCSLCNYVAKRRDHLKSHRLTVHEKFKPHQCPMCKFFATTPNNLQQHMINKHQSPSKFNCGKCNRPFAARALLNNHEKRCKGPVDPEKKNFLCDHCAFSSAHKSSLNSHIRMVHEKKEYHACPHCDYVSIRKSNFKAHLIYKHKYESAHKCDTCTRQFSCPAKLKEHKERCGTAPVQLLQNVPAEYAASTSTNWHTPTPIPPAAADLAVFYG